MRRFILVLPLLAVLAGCYDFSVPEPAPPQNPPGQGDATYLPQTALADETQAEPETAVESALAWSEKYSKAVEKLLQAQQENRDLLETNKQLLGQQTKLQTELTQTKRELGDANAMLLELRGELEKWKKDILGFRREIRTSQEAQLEALAKVLKLLGGEVPAPTTRPAEKKASQPKEVASETDY
jgi:chromosome segregation ATPase